MTHTFLIELTDEVKGYEREVEHLEMTYGIEEFDLKKHDSELLDKVIQKQRTIIDDDGTMYKVVFLEDIEEMKAEVQKGAENESNIK